MCVCVCVCVCVSLSDKTISQEEMSVQSVSVLHRNAS